MKTQIADYKQLKTASKFKKSFLLIAFTLFFGGLFSMASEDSNSHQHNPDENHGVEHAENGTHLHADEHSSNHHSEDSEGGHGDEEYNAGEMILEHIADAHDWHLFDYNGKAYSVPLPVIIYNKERGLSVFMSSKFHHGHEPYDGYRLEDGKIVNNLESDNSEFYDLSFTKNVAAMFVSMFILLFILFAVKKAYLRREGQAPKGIQSVMEPLIVFLRDEVVKPSIGKGYERFMPLLLTIFFFIFANNLLGLIPILPGGANVTGNIAITLVLAVIVFIVTHAVAKKDYWKHIFMPDVPKALYPILIPIEILGVFTKPIVLCLRLFANITAGHIIILGFFSLIFIFGQMAPAGGFGAGVFSMAFVLFMSFLELLVAFLQAYVFTLLSALYIGMAMEEHHSEEHAH